MFRDFVSAFVGGLGIRDIWIPRHKNSIMHHIND